MDKHNAAIKREHQKLIKAWAALGAAMGQLGASRISIMRVKQELAPYIASVQWFFDSQPNWVPGDSQPDQPPAYSELPDTDETGVDSQPDADTVDSQPESEIEDGQSDSEGE